MYFIIFFSLFNIGILEATLIEHSDDNFSNSTINDQSNTQPLYMPDNKSYGTSKTDKDISSSLDFNHLDTQWKEFSKNKEFPKQFSEFLALYKVCHSYEGSEFPEPIKQALCLSPLSGLIASLVGMVTLAIFPDPAIKIVLSGALLSNLSSVIYSITTLSTEKKIKKDSFNEVMKMLNEKTPPEKFAKFLKFLEVKKDPSLRIKNFHQYIHIFSVFATTLSAVSIMAYCSADFHTISIILSFMSNFFSLSGTLLQMDEEFQRSELMSKIGVDNYNVNCPKADKYQINEKNLANDYNENKEIRIAVSEDNNMLS